MTTSATKPPTYRYTMKELLAHLEAKGLKRNRSTVGKWMRNRRFPHYKIGGGVFFDLYQVERWLEAQHRGMALVQTP